MSSIVCEPKRYAPGELESKAANNFMVPIPYKIRSIHWETGAGDIFTWELESADGSRLTYVPGQFNMLYIHGCGEVPISISSSHESGPLIHTTKAVGSVTKKMAQMQVGDIIGLRGPFGSRWPIAAAEGKDVVIIAGGLGLPPLRPVIYHILNQRNKFARVHLLYGAKTPHDIVYKSELDTWLKKHDIHVSIIVDKPEGHWQGQVGVVPDLLKNLDIEPSNTIAMMCGPEVMMHYSQLSLSAMGLKNSQIVISMERNMKCAVGHCGHCQWGPHFICKDGPVYYFDQIEHLFKVDQL